MGVNFNFTIVNLLKVVVTRNAVKLLCKNCLNFNNAQKPSVNGLKFSKIDQKMDKFSYFYQI